MSKDQVRSTKEALSLEQTLRLALEALEWSKPHADAEITYQEAITAIKAALEAKDEPVAWLKVNEDSWTISLDAEPDHIPLYTTPPQRNPLTDEEIEDVWASCEADWDDKVNVLTLARAIEAAHGIIDPTDLKGEA